MLSLLAAAMLAILPLAHPDHDEPGLIVHFAPGIHEVQEGHVEDATHTVRARIVGEPKSVTIGPAVAYSFNGAADYLVIADKLDGSRRGLPSKAITVETWVNLSETVDWGSMIGCIQDNGDAEKGWLLGYNKQSFYFALASAGADDGNGKMTYMSGKSRITTGRWYHVVGTYDGESMRLYVNGQLDAESREQSGDILYDETAPYTIGCYLDRDEKHALDGALHRVKVYNRALTPEQIAAVATKNENLWKYEPGEDDLVFLVEPYLQFATLNSIVVMSETDRPSSMTVEYGTAQPLEFTAETTEDSLLGEVHLVGLEPQTTYFYRVTRIDPDGRMIRSPIRSLQTAVPADMPWSFAIIGDTQRNPDVTRKCAEGAYSMRPNFLLHCGDVVDDGFAKNQWLKDFFEPCKNLLAYVPVYPVIGNHEKNADFYYQYFALPSPEYYYTFTYGNAQFFMVDSNKDCSPGSEQYNRLEADLAASKATWKFAAHHHPPFSSDNDDYGDTMKGDPDKRPVYGDRRVRNLVPLYEKYGVDMVFNGHIHSYERTWPIFEMKINPDKGVRYVVSGGGGGGLETSAPNRVWFTHHVKRAHHYCYLVVHDRTMQFKAYDIDGLLFDQFELTKAADR